MLHACLNEQSLRQFTPEQLQALFLSAYPTFSERVSAMDALLRGASGPALREQIGRWVIQRLPAKEIVPEKYSHWRPLVQDAMLFMFLHLSIERLAPKLIEQMELPPDTPTGKRLLKLIAKVPGLQKLGQVLARNRHLHRRLRRSLAQLENGISDMEASQIKTIIVSELGARLEAASVKIRPGIFFEASVSAVMRFTWQNPETGCCERGVFKVMKPHIASCFAEDMRLLADLAKYIESKHRDYGFARHVLPNTFSDVRRLLQHEVDFPREQATLLEACRIYGGMIGVRVPRLIPGLSTSRITAMTEERGKKITSVVVRMPEWRRERIAERLIEAFVAVPLFSLDQEAMFHADPHAGNLLYDHKSGDIVILDWALTDRVNSEERRHLAMLFLLTALRDPDGICFHIEELSRGSLRRRAAQRKIIRESVQNFIAQLPIARVPGTGDAFDLLERIAMRGVRLSAPLIMMRKVLFTLDGVQHDMGDPQVSMISIIIRHAAQRWLTNWTSFKSPLSMRDWMALQSSTLFYGGRVCWQGAQALLERAQGSE